MAEKNKCMGDGMEIREKNGGLCRYATVIRADGRYLARLGNDLARVDPASEPDSSTVWILREGKKEPYGKR